MKAERIEVDSRVFGGAVLAIHDFDPEADWETFERGYIAEHHPVYVTCKVPVEQTGAIHKLEDAGFRLIECQIRSMIRFRRMYDVSAFDYEFSRVTREEDLDEVLEIAGTTFVHDRFCMDQSVGPEVSSKRYREYVRKSLNTPQEAVYRLIERGTGQVVAFKTHKYLNDTEVLLLLGGVRADLKNAGIGLINEYFEFNELMRKGIKSAITHISAANYPIVNLEIGKVGFRVMTTFAVLRKVMPESASNG